MKKLNCVILLSFLIILIEGCSNAPTTSADIFSDSTSDFIVLNCHEETVTPYSRSKILTITDVKVNEKMVTLSYKLESTMTENPVLIANYTEGNIACATTNFHYYSEEITSNRYTMTKNKIEIECVPDSFVSGNVLVRIFLVREEDNETPYMAISNVASLRMNF